MAKRRRVPPTPPRAIGRTRPLQTATARGAGTSRPVLLAAGAVGILAVIVIVGVLLANSGPVPSPSPSTALGPTATIGPPASLIAAPVLPTADASGAYPPISGVRCDLLEQTAYHIHAHVAIRFGGELHAVPADIGIRDTCLYWLHTHRDSGIIHVEAPAETSFTLGQFFAVWGQVLAPRQVLDRPLTAFEGIYVFVDRVRYDGDPRAIVLSDLENIEIQVGTAPFQPLPYDFPADIE